MTQEKANFDFEQALKDLQAGKPLSGKEGILTPLIKSLTEAALEAEVETHLSQDIVGNRRNGKSSKKLKTGSGSFELNTPRDRDSSFLPR